MKTLFKATLASLFLLIVSPAKAVILDFINLTESPTGYGEGAFTTLTVTDGGITTWITGHGSADDDATQYAYLDWARAGLGVCKDAVNLAEVDKLHPKSPNNNCNPANDDNVTTDEYLVFKFSENVVVKNVWFNNNHDGGLDAGDQALIAGNPYNITTGYAGGANGVGSFAVAMGEDFVVAFANEQFYISGIEIMKVAEPSSLILFGLGLLSLTRIRSSRKD